MHPLVRMDARTSNRLAVSSLFALAVGLALAPLAEAKLKNEGQGEASFTAAGPAGMQIVGRTPDLSLSDDGAHVKVVVTLDRLTTGIALRDRHMREKYLEVAKYPSAELTVDRAALKLGADAQANVPATMKIHGQTRAVTIHYASHRDGNATHVTGSVHVEMTDYGIEAPSYLGVKVKPGVDITVHFDALEV